MTVESLNIALINGDIMDPTIDMVLKYIGAIAESRNHRTTLQQSMDDARAFVTTEPRPEVDAAFIYHDPYNPRPIATRVAGLFREFYPDIPIAVILPKEAIADTAFAK